MGRNNTQEDGRNRSVSDLKQVESRSKSRPGEGVQSTESAILGLPCKQKIGMKKKGFLGKNVLGT